MASRSFPGRPPACHRASFLRACSTRPPSGGVPSRTDRIANTLTGIVGTLYLVESPSPPALFSWGRRCRQADEGAFHALVIRARLVLSGFLGPVMQDRSCRAYAPLIRLRHLLPPQQTADG